MSRRLVRLAAGLVLLAAAGFLAGDRLLADYRFRQALAAERADDLTAAAAGVGWALARWPDDPDVRLLAARVGWREQLRQSFPAGWDRPLREHLKVAARQPQALYRVSQETDLIDVLAGDLTGPYGRVVARLKADPPDAVALLEALVRANLDAHRLTDAHRLAGELNHRRPDHALGHFWRGLATELSGRVNGEADADYRRAVELDPDNYEYRMRLAGYLALRRTNLPEVRPMVERLRSEQPERPDAQRLYGLVTLDLGEFDAARPVVERLATANPSDGEAAVLLGRLELAADRVAPAERWLREAVRRAPGSHAAHAQLAQCLARAGKPDEAKAEFDRADRLRTDRELVARLARQAAERPTDARVRYVLGVVCVRSGDWPVGARWLESALAVDPEFEPARQALDEYFTERRRSAGPR